MASEFLHGLDNDFTSDAVARVASSLAPRADA